MSVVMNKSFEALQDLYDIIEKSKRWGLALGEDFIRQINEAEENIIREQILPIIGLDIEPTLSHIQRNLVLVVEYQPGEPVKVALSRKTNISQIVDAKPIVAKPYKLSIPVTGGAPAQAMELHEPTKTIKNHTKGLKVTFPDGTIVCHKTAIETEIDVFRRIGFERVSKVGLMKAGWPVVGRKQRPIENGHVWQHQASGWFIYSNTSNSQKKADLQAVSDYYGLGLIIESGKPEETGD